MIILIGGAPRVGKSTIAKQFAESIKGRFISTDELENPYQHASVIFYGDPKKNILTPSKRMDCVKDEARMIFSIISEIIENAIGEPQNTVIEGVHLFPGYVDKFTKKYGEDKIKAIFIGSTNIELILEGMMRNTSPNNWLKDCDEEVLRQIALFTKAFSAYVHDESKKYNLRVKEKNLGGKIAIKRR